MKTFQEGHNELEAANKRLLDASKEVSLARQHECDALNAVNNLQKEFDALLVTFKKAAPTSMDWSKK